MPDNITREKVLCKSCVSVQQPKDSCKLPKAQAGEDDDRTAGQGAAVE